MPLSKARMRERKRLDRVKPAVKPGPTPKEDKLSNLRQLLDAPQSPKKPLKEESNTNLYNEGPEIDAEGYPIPDY